MVFHKVIRSVLKRNKKKHKKNDPNMSTSALSIVSKDFCTSTIHSISRTHNINDINQGLAETQLLIDLASTDISREDRSLLLRVFVDKKSK